jgi:photosystem II stability/assembly factor-like uncharacterized protein
MRVKPYIASLFSAMLVSGVAWMAGESGAGNLNKSFRFEQAKEGEEEIGPALEYLKYLRANEVTGTIEPEWVEAAVAQADRLSMLRRNASIQWTNMGPDNIGGRCRALLLDKDSMNLWFMGGVSGGLFRSNTGGLSWAPINDKQENLNVTCIAQTPDGTIYYGTGEGGFTNLSGTRNGSPAFIGNGLYKSSNRSGTAFTRMANTADSRFYECNSMAAHPTQDKLYVATQSGLYLLTNGGTAIATVRGGECKEVKLDKNGVLWCSFSDGRVYKSDANGGNLALQNYGGPNGRASIAISPEDPNYVYLQNAQSRLNGVYRTTDGGATWQQIIYYNSVTDNMGTGQGYYDNVCCVDPTNKNRVYLGGVVLGVWDNVDGYREIASMFDAPWNTGYVHADKHIIQFDTRVSPALMLVGCDGGLFGSRDRSTWTRMNRNFTTYQCYNIAANSLGHMAGGSQDNGTQLINFSGNSFNGVPSKTALEIYSGDGFDVEFSRFFPKTIFVSTYYGRIARTANSGQSSSTFWDDRIKPDDAAANPPDVDFNTHFVLWEKNDTSSRLFLARNSEVWVAINPTDFINDVSWFRVASGLGNDRILEMDYTPDGDHLFIAKAGRLIRLDNLNAANYTVAANPGAGTIPAAITNITMVPSGTSSRVITSVNVDQSDENHVIITLGGYGSSAYVMESKDALSANPTWNNITGDLPKMPVYDAVIDPDKPSRIILGTDLGVFVTENGGTNWTEANTGMARVPVFEIRGYEWKPWEGMKLYIGTHGRGYYQSMSLTTGVKKVPSVFTGINAFPVPATDALNVTFNSVSSEKVSIEVYSLNGSKMQSLTLNAAAGQNKARLNIASLSNGSYFVRITGAQGSNAVKFTVMK